MPACLFQPCLPSLCLLKLGDGGQCDARGMCLRPMLSTRCCAGRHVPLEGRRCLMLSR